MIVLAVVDSLRRDVFEKFFTLDGYYYNNFRSQATLTPASMYAILTGKAWRNRNETDLFDYFSNKGLSTVSYTHANLLLVDGYDYSNWNRVGKVPLSGWADSLTELPDKFFVFLHFWSTHLPYGIKLNKQYNGPFKQYGVEAAKELLRREDLPTMLIRDKYEQKCKVVLERLMGWARDFCGTFIITADHAEGLEDRYRNNVHEFFHGGSGEHLYKIPLWSNKDLGDQEDHISLHNYIKGLL